QNLMANVQAMGELFHDRLNGLKEKHALVGDVRGKGLMWGLELVKDRASKEHATAEAVAVMEAARERGLLIGKGGLHGNVIRFSPPYTISREECERVVEVLDQCLTAVAGT
ncbi:MAG: aminotransferase class III-fold pyridoxal phosphate-dependent enzyme, partial [Candidatus Sericytochromatia bacterium]